MFCWQCKTETQIETKPARGDTCPNCSADLRCCYNCEFYDKSAHHECREPQAEWVNDKTKANFCDYFSPAQKLMTTGRKKVSKDETKKKWDELFKKK